MGATTSKSAVILGPWGGSGGNSFDDGWNNGGVTKLIIYYDTILNGLQVTYGNGNVELHGQASGQTKEIDNISSSAPVGVSVTVGTNAVFVGDTSNTGVVAVGFTVSDTPNSFPSGVNGTVYLPHVLGFFGSAGTYLDRLGLYVSNV